MNLTVFEKRALKKSACPGGWTPQGKISNKRAFSLFMRGLIAPTRADGYTATAKGLAALKETTP